MDYDGSDRLNKAAAAQELWWPHVNASRNVDLGSKCKGEKREEQCAQAEGRMVASAFRGLLCIVSKALSLRDLQKKVRLSNRSGWPVATRPTKARPFFYRLDWGRSHSNFHWYKRTEDPRRLVRCAQCHPYVQGSKLGFYTVVSLYKA